MLNKLNKILLKQLNLNIFKDKKLN